MKYFSPSFSYTVPPQLGLVVADPLVGCEVESDVLGGVLGVGEHDRPVVLVDHPAVVRGHVLLELGGVEEAFLLAEGFGDLVVDEYHPATGVDAVLLAPTQFALGFVKSIDNRGIGLEDGSVILSATYRSLG